MKTLFLCLFFLLTCIPILAQKETIISGKIIDKKSQLSMVSVAVSIQNTNEMQLTSLEGKFQIKTKQQNNQLISIHSNGYQDKLIQVVLTPGDTLDLGIIPLEEKDDIEKEAGNIALLESDLTDDTGGTESSSGMLQATRDAYQQAAAFNWGAARYRVRGLDSKYAVLMINGIKMNKVFDGRPQWANWGGINDVLRNQDLIVGTSPSEFNFGDLLATQNINTQAGHYRKGTRISFSGTNTNYQNRMMITYASGMNNQGWALVVAAGIRYASEGYFDGTPYKASSFFASLEKKITDNHSLNFTAFFTPNSRGKNSPNTDEVVSLTSKRYNSYWGYHNGKQRNSRIRTIEEPVFVLNDYIKMSEKTVLNLGALYQFGKVSNSNIDFQRSNNPDPSHHRKMPSYFYSIYAPDEGEFSGVFTPDIANAELNKYNFVSQPQIDWAAMYLANQNPITYQNGRIIGFEPGKSRYIVYEDRTDDSTFAFNTLLNSKLNETLRLNAGGSFSSLYSHNYQKAIDLLGGAYFDDIDPFYKGDQAQSDLNNPNRQIRVGDRYGYNYSLMVKQWEGFTQLQFQYKKIDFYFAQEFSTTNYQREGYYKNGLYPTTSFGKSTKVQFENFGFKGGLVLKLTGKQLVLLNGLYATKAPSLRSVFTNSRLNNNIVDQITNEKNNSFDASYIYRAPKLKIRLSSFFNEITGGTENSFFYAEGIFDNGAGNNNTSAFVSQTLTQLDKKNWGTEWSLEYQIAPTLKSTFAAGVGKYIYSSNPNVTITNDAKASAESSLPVFDFGTAALKNYRQAGMPQQAYSIGLEYRNPKYWWVSANANYLADRYVDISPIARTAIFFTNPVSGFPFPEATKERGLELLQQEELPPVILLNLVGGKSWRVSKKNLNLFFSINNLFNTTYKTGGFEQARNANFRQRNQDVSSGSPNFANKYFYGNGRTFFISLAFNL
jgi:hypothetical protein